jgi:hypothetical protein
VVTLAQVEALPLVKAALAAQMAKELGTAAATDLLVAAEVCTAGVPAKQTKLQVKAVAVLFV